MAAARLMVELGEPPEDAIQKVRHARGRHAIELGRQEQHVRGCTPLLVAPMLLDRMLGCLLGGAVGDAFGYEVEFDRWAQIKKRFGPKGIDKPAVHDGKIRVSDDTQMTLFTLEGLVRSKQAVEQHDIPAVLERIRLAYLDWLYTQGEQPDGWKPAGEIAKDSRLRRRQAPGMAILSAMRAGGKGSPEKPINDSKGCGGVMRVAPFGLLRTWQPTEATELAARAAALTHGHPSGYLSAATMAAIVRLLLDAVDLEYAAHQAKGIVSDWKGVQETSDKIDAALEAAQRRDGDPRTNVSSLGEGWIGEEALSVGLYCALAGSSFPDVLSIAANHDGDSDSTASIAGQLYGAWKGLADLPNHWIRKLDILGILLGLLRRAVV
jgi:ADP-ribosyl-[dinitrogen reductase] hydrolase